MFRVQNKTLSNSFKNARKHAEMDNEFCWKTHSYGKLWQEQAKELLKTMSA